MRQVNRVALALLLAAALQLRGQSKPVDLSLGWNFADADQGHGSFSSVNGWYGTLNWELTPRVGLAFSHESYWGAVVGGGVNEHVYLGGITVELRHDDPRFKPFVQPFGGITRASGGGIVELQPTFELAIGADVTLMHGLSLEVIPAEYAYSHGSAGSLSTYQAAAGLQYTFRRRRASGE